MLNDAPYHIRLVFVGILTSLILLIFRFIYTKFIFNKVPLIKSITAITLLLVLAVGCTWGISMVGLTMITAQEVYDKLYDESYDFLEYVDRCGMLGDFYDEDFGRYGMQYERPDMLEYHMLDAISMNTSRNYYNGRGEKYPMETAVLFYDRDGNLLHSSEDDIMFFNYFTQEEWDLGMDSASGLHYGWIDISAGKDAEDQKDDLYLKFRDIADNLLSIRAIRVTGTFNGNELKPVAIYYITDAQIQQVLESSDQFSIGENAYSYIISDLDRTGRLDWQMQFDNTEEYAEDDLVTVYADRPETWDYKDAALTYNGEEYENLVELTQTLDLSSLAEPYLSNGVFSDKGVYDLDDLLIFQGKKYVSYSGEMDVGTVDFILVTAIRSNPLACAVNLLKDAYIVTGIIALVIIMAVRSSIKTCLIVPLDKVVRAMENDWAYNVYQSEKNAVWRETDKLISCFTAEQDWRRMRKNELTRMKTALEYAQTAEKHRREMTSNIAHELKTPLSVIHSYAEGLKEHIADEKREKYIDVIISEAERTDGLVLEMLDLSRLEAGKVKLSRDDFSLIELTRDVFEKLALTIEAKKIKLDYYFPEDFLMTADESRIAQVVENFASNAVKYTTDGGHISVKIENQQKSVRFAIENDCKPLAEEDLSKVWEAFYRADRSRSGNGTGLGLAIAKSIVELHGGKCFVKNTLSGVEFGFII